MSKYTMELNEVIEVLAEQGKQLFDFDYELPDVVDKEKLQQYFIDYYNFREIGLETIPRFKQRLQTYWGMVCRKYEAIFTNYYNSFVKSSPLHNYEYNIDDTNTFKATPMSSLDPSKTYATTITDVKGKHSGITTDTPIYKLFNGLYDVDNSPFNNFIKEFDCLFMGVL